MAKGHGKYDWGKGGKVHSIPLATHEQNAAAKKALGGTLDLTAPPTPVQAVGEANSAADLQFGPQVAAAKQAQANVAPWFQDYMARVAGYAQAAQQLNAPVLQQAQAYQQSAGQQTAPGLDPGSAAGQQSAQAAAGRGALAQLGLDALNSNANATQAYFGGQQNMAARVLPQQQQAAQQQLANAESQRGAAVQGFLTTARQNAQNYAIARGTLGLNAAKAESDAAAADASNSERNRHNRATETNQANSATARQQAAADKAAADAANPNKYGIPQAQWDHWTTRHRQRVIDAFNERHAQGQSNKDAAKHAADVHAATGTIENKVSDIIGAWDSHSTDQTNDETKPIPDAQGRKPGTPNYKPTYKPRNLTPAELKKVLVHEGYSAQMIHIALLRRAQPPKPLDQASIDYLHNLDPNFRIPRDWLPPRLAGNPTPDQADREQSPPPPAASGGNPHASGKTSTGNMPNLGQILANPQQYTPKQVAAAKQLKGQGAEPTLPIDKDGRPG